MRKITTILTLLLVCIVGAYAVDLRVDFGWEYGTYYKKGKQANYPGSQFDGTIAGAGSKFCNKWISADTYGTHLTVQYGDGGTGSGSTTENNFNCDTNAFCYGTSCHTVNISVGAGFVITGYVIKGASESTSTSVTVTPADGGTAKEFTSSTTTLTVSGLKTTSTSFTISAAANKYINVEEFYFTVEEQKPANYAAASRVTSLTEGTEYFIYNTAYTGGDYANRYGFIYYDGSVKNYGGSVPETFSTTNANYRFTVKSNGDGTYTLNSVGQNTAIGTAFTFTPWTEAASGIKSGSAQVRNDDGTYTANADINASTAVWVIGTGGKGNSAYWNGNNWNSVGGNCFVTWSNGHPYAIYAITEVVDLAESETTLNDNIWKLQELYGIHDAGKITSNSSDSQEGNLAALIDNKYTTYHHSDWHEAVKETHNITFELTDITDAIRFYIKQRETGTGQPLDVTVSASNDGSSFTDIVNFPSLVWGGNPSDMYSELVQASQNYKYWRFTVNNANRDASKKWFCASEWYVLPNNATVNEFFDAANLLRAASKTLDATTRTNAVNAVNSAKSTLDADIAAHTKYTITYRVLDGSNNVLASSNAELYVGTHVTALPANMYRNDFYDYSDVDVTVTSDMNIDAVATLKTNPLIQFTADATSPVWYVLKLKDANYPTYVEGGTPNVTTPTTSANNQTVHWAFVGSPYEGFHIINRAAGTSLVLGSASAANDGNNGGNTYATLAAEGTQAYELWFPTGSPYYTNGFYLYNGEGIALNQRNTANFAYWTGGQGTGSTFVATLAPTDSELYDICITQLESINWGTGLNQYSFTGTYAGYTSQAGSIIDGLKTQGYSASNLEIAQALLANYALNLPAAGFYRIKGNTSGKYLAEGMASNNKFAMTDATDASTIFYFDGTKLVNYNSGMTNGMNSGAWAWVLGDGAVSTVEFQDGLTNGGYAIMSQKSDNTNKAWFYDNGDNSNSADRGGNLTISTSTNARYTSWYLTEVTELPLTLTDVSQWGVDGSYTTMYMPVNVTVNGAKVYTVTGNVNGSLTVEELAAGDVVPANTGVILEGTSGNATATVSTADGTATSELTGTVPAIGAVADSYVLSVSNSKLGFYKFAGTEMKGFRAYYVPTSGNADPTRGFVINFGETTGVGSVVLGNGSSVYDLQGRRVNNAQKGVFIINGKKVVK